MGYISCSKKEAKLDLFNDEDFHAVLYTNPSSDCVDCIFKALKSLDANASEGEPIYVLLKPSKDNERFVNYVKSEFRTLRTIKFIEHTLDVPVSSTPPTPSIVMMRKKKIYMWLYIQNDPFLFEKCIEKCLQLFSNIKH